MKNSLLFLLVAQCGLFCVSKDTSKPTLKIIMGPEFDYNNPVHRSMLNHLIDAGRSKKLQEKKDLMPSMANEKSIQENPDKPE